MRWFFALLSVLFLTNLSAQENPSLDWNIDSIFNEAPQNEEETPETDEITVMQILNRRSLTFNVSFGFITGISPGWREPPWRLTADEENEDGDNENNFAWTPIVRMSTSFGLDAQISEIFGVKAVFYFIIPYTSDDDNFRFLLGDFFFDYNFLNTIYFRGGKYSLKWGISPNYDFTNLLARIPKNVPANDSIIFKADIPAGVGGLQFLALTRANLTGGDKVSKENIGLGGKFNLALRKLDMDTGVFYHYGMPFRGFISLKTTFINTEVYSEGLVAFTSRRDNENNEPSSISGAVNFGIVRDFFKNKLSVNGEFFYNNEGNSFMYSTRTDFEDPKVSPFISGLNIAFNILYRFQGKGNPRFFIQSRYAIQEESIQLTPGIRINPWSHIELYFAVPMTFGNKDGYYYKNPAIIDKDGNKRRFAAVLLLNLSGDLRYTHYF
ncbi:MAG: hypothetical protein LBQ93_05785 [Treponema sp.]|jgi:hypothetical protein|nr:hypothetical protein [Treponema sp.]